MCFNAHTEKLIQIKLKEILNKFVDSSDRKKGFYEVSWLVKKKTDFEILVFSMPGCFMLLKG